MLWPRLDWCKHDYQLEPRPLYTFAPAEETMDEWIKIINSHHFLFSDTRGTISEWFVDEIKPTFLDGSKIDLKTTDDSSTRLLRPWTVLSSHLPLVRYRSGSWHTDSIGTFSQMWMREKEEEKWGRKKEREKEERKESSGMFRYIRGRILIYNWKENFWKKVGKDFLFLVTSRISFSSLSISSEF